MTLIGSKIAGEDVFLKREDYHKNLFRKTIQSAKSFALGAEKAQSKNNTIKEN